MGTRLIAGVLVGSSCDDLLERERTVARLSKSASAKSVCKDLCDACRLGEVDRRCNRLRCRLRASGSLLYCLPDFRGRRITRAWTK